MKNSNKVEIVFSLWQAGVHPEQISAQLNIHRATTYRWIKDFQHLGLNRTLIKRSKSKSRTQSRKINQVVKNRIYKIRKDKRDCCGEKIRYYYKQEYGETISVGKIYEVLREKYSLSSKYKKEKKYGEAPRGITDRDVVQGDTVDFGNIYAYTYVDTFNRQGFVDLELDLESMSGYASLLALSEVFQSINILQTDGGPEFKGEFQRNILNYAKVHRVSRAYKKNEQSFIESFNRTLRKECLGWGKYRASELPHTIRKVQEFMVFYNNERPHLGLGMRTPNEVASCRICG